MLIFLKNSKAELRANLSRSPKRAKALQEVLKNGVTGKLVAYKTTYIYFNKDTMEFERSFSVFYLALDAFEKNAFEQSENIVHEKGKINILDFPELLNVHFKIPCMRSLTYINNGIAIITESEMDFILTDDGAVDEVKTLEKYGQNDKDFINVMKSIII